MSKERDSLSLATRFTDFSKVFLNYAKARSQVYIYVFATFVSFCIYSDSLLSLQEDLYITFLIIGSNLIAISYLLSMATYIYNDLADLDVDIINKPKRPLVQGRVKASSMLWWVVILNIIALTLSMSIGIITFIIALVYVLLSISYSHPKINLKSKFPWKTIVNASGAALLSLLGGIISINNIDPFYDQSNVFIQISFTALSFFAFIFITAPLADIVDIKGDKQGGRRTLPIVLGVKSTLLIMYSIPVIITIAIIALWFSNTIYIGTLGLLAILISCLLAETQIFIIHRRLRQGSLANPKKTRTKIRLTHIMLQSSLFVAFIL